MRWIILSLVFSMNLANTVMTQVPTTQADIDLIVSRLKNEYLNNMDSSNAGMYVFTERGTAASYLSTPASDGSWSDIDYTDRGRVLWNPSKHLERLNIVAAAYQKLGCPYFHDESVRTAVLKGLEYWYTVAPTSTNWWWNLIGKQHMLARIAILMDQEMTPTLRRLIINDMAVDGKIPASGIDFQGVNRVWVVQQMIWRGCLERSNTLTRDGVQELQSALTITSEDGIQTDFSFDQHGAILYNAGYGSDFLDVTSFWAYVLMGTEFAFSEGSVHLMSTFHLQGNRWMVHGTMFDYSADGREICRKDQNALPLLAICDRLAAVDPALSPEHLAFKAHIRGEARAPVTGNRHFWHNDFMTHIRDDYYVSVKMNSIRTFASESLNGENLKGQWLSMGVSLISLTGDEYDNIMPVWDWAALPGVTCPSNTATVGQPNGRSTATFVGGVSNGTYGIAAMDLDVRDPNDGSHTIRARKAMFFFDNEIVALGAGISSDDAVDPIHTTINQCYLRGEVTVDGNVMNDVSSPITARWVYHNRIGYVFPDKTQVMLRTARRVTGSWSSINAQYSPGDVAVGDLFLLALDHGVTPTDARYQYIIAPGMTAIELTGYAKEIPVRIIANSKELQAVSNDSLQITGIVFYRPGRLQLRPDLVVTVDTPCIVLVDESQSVSEPKITVSNPANEAISLRIGFEYSRGPERALTIQLPGGAYAGKSLTTVLLRRPYPRKRFIR